MKIKLVDVLDTPYRNIVDENGIMYCEMELKRDRSSFAGMAFKIVDDNEITCIEIKDRIYDETNKYEKLYVGIDKDYYNSICCVYNKKKLKYGIKVFFLVYSNVRSIQMIFTNLMEWICDNI